MIFCGLWGDGVLRMWVAAGGGVAMRMWVAAGGGGGVAMRTPDEGERAWLPAPIPEC